MISTTTILIFFGFIAFTMILIFIMKVKTLGRKMDAGDFIQSLALGAVRHAKMEYRAALDFSAESIERIDAILALLHARHASGRLTDKAVRSESNIWGAYVGETIRRRNGGRWETCRGGGEDVFVLVVDDESAAQPFEWCLEGIQTGDPEFLQEKCRPFFPPDSESPDMDSFDV